MEMTRVDLRNYLERIYNVPVAAVRTRVQHGSNRKRDHRNVRVKKPDQKVAYVQLTLVNAKGHRPARGSLLCTRPAQGRVRLLLRAGQERIRVQAHGQTFTFPDLFPDKKPSPEGGSVDNSLWDLPQRQTQDPRRGGVPDWFGL
nr:39S ribosomal protein L23, mitochondrial isoform X3 [Manis javanica]XP_017509653.1 39S ribosomal protein L23, mitochondrial isoform X3 [Manis javanica]